ncbi:Endonuclease/exonuclease/phosphatase, partial [Thelephora terrestris]
IKGRRSGDIEKWMHIPQVMRENNLGVMAIQETHLTDELANQFKELFGNRLELFYSPDPLTRNARGVAIVVNKRHFKTEEIKTTEIVPGRAITVELPWHDEQTIKILAIYAPNAPRETKDFWRSVIYKIDESRDLVPDIMVGDFNLVEDAIDRLPSNQDDAQSTEILRELKMKYNLTDGWRKANPDEKAYTWSRDSDGTQSRIDRIYVREDYFDNCADWDINPTPIPSDHDLISAKISTPTSPKIGRGRWAIPTRLIKNRTIRKEIQRLGQEYQSRMERAQNDRATYKPQRILKKFKTQVRETIRAHEKKIQPMLKKRVENLSKKLQETLNN